MHNTFRSESVTAQATQRFLVDTHAHFHDCYDADDFVNAAITNATRISNAAPCVMLADTETSNSLDVISDRLTSVESEFSVRRLDSKSATVERANRCVGVLIRGRQVRTCENIEVLVFGPDLSIRDGETFRSTIHNATERGMLCIVPWGFGKWWGRRKRLIGNALSGLPTVALGENACRPPSFAIAGSIQSTFESRRFRILPGSDPLPIRSDLRRVGSLGLIVDVAVALPNDGTDAHVANRIVDSIVRGHGTASGQHVSLVRFAYQQLCLRCRRITKR